MPGGAGGGGGNTANEKPEKGDESEEQGEDGSGKTYLEVDFDILNVFQSPSPSGYSYIALLGEWRMHIYSVYEEESTCCGITSVWDFNYRFDSFYKKYGKQISLDFEEGCQGFVTGTNIGWVLIFSLVEKVMQDAIYIRNPENSRVPESFDIIRDIVVERYFVCYSKKTQHLLFFENLSQEKKKKPIVKLYPFDH